MVALMAEVGANSAHPDRRAGERRKPDARVMPADGADTTKVAGYEEGEGKRHHAVRWKMSGGSCHEGTTPKIGNTTIFVESKEMAPVGTEVVISFVPKREEAVAKELVQGTVVWHCPLGDAFQNQAGFGVSLQQHAPKKLALDIVDGPKKAT